MVTTIREHHPIEKVRFAVLTEFAGLCRSLALLLPGQACTSDGGCAALLYRLGHVCQPVVVCFGAEIR